MLRPVTKWNARIERPETVPEVVRKAFKLAEAERPGPAHLELSETIAAAELPSSARPLAEEPPRAPRPDRGGRARGGRDRPRGPAARDPDRQRHDPRPAPPRELRALCEHAGIPACPTFMGKGALDDRSLLSLPAVGVQARDSMTAGLDEADVVVCVGYDLVEFGPAAWNGEQRKRIVHVDARAGRGRRRLHPRGRARRRRRRDAAAAAPGAARPGGAALRHPPARRRHHRAARDGRAARLRQPAGGDPRDPRGDGARRTSSSRTSAPTSSGSAGCSRPTSRTR